MARRRKNTKRAEDAQPVVPEAQPGMAAEEGTREPGAAGAAAGEGEPVPPATPADAAARAGEAQGGQVAAAIAAPQDEVASGGQGEVASGEQGEVASGAQDDGASTSEGEDSAASVWGDNVATLPSPAQESEVSAEDARVWQGEGEDGAAPEEAPADQGEEAAEALEVPDLPQMESIMESLLFASDKALGLGDFKRLLGERDGKKIQAALDELVERRKESGIQVVRLATGWHLRTNHENARWVSKLLAGKPMRLSRAMMETLAIVAYRQPVTRPEIDDIRGVDCGPVLKTLLDRGLIRIIGKKEEVGRPLLYGTTPEFLRVFNLRELSELPTLREFYELSEDQQAHVEAEHGPAPVEAAPGVAPVEAAPGASGDARADAPAVAAAPAAAPTKKEPPKLSFVPRESLPPEEDDADPLLDELECATKAARKALGAAAEPPAEGEASAEAVADDEAKPGSSEQPGGS